jgi:tetratricopeptide (TPR) repeat protein
MLSGHESIDLVPTYLLLGKASIGLKQYSQAEEYLSMAKWALLKLKDFSQEIRGLLHRNIGLLYLSKGNYEDALKETALDVHLYFNSRFIIILIRIIQIIYPVFF